MTSLTPRMAACLDIVREMAAAGMAPSLGDIERRLGLSSRSGAHRLLHALADAGYVTVEAGVGRSARLTARAFGSGMLAGLSTADLDVLALRVRAEQARRAPEARG